MSKHLYILVIYIPHQAILIAWLKGNFIFLT